MDQKSSSVNVVVVVVGSVPAVPAVVAVVVGGVVKSECWPLSVGREDRRQDRVTARAELVRVVKSLMCS